ncbi:PREDICTED: salivary glue protein Sgs-3-like [Ipomoea nil]|uniref:salivary glue protein Sgs-3-like n=1 Tax=Ipomoea nil TaxID=35883 RepID=UPI000901FEB2|nr:PREDICTED: salivary glue protein Sgs-3-like [Ipomoea nil]
MSGTQTQVNQKRRNTKKKTAAAAASVPPTVPPTASVPPVVPPTASVPPAVPPTTDVPTVVPVTADVPTAVPPTDGSIIEEIQHFWNEAERVASLFDIQIGVQPQHEEITITQPDIGVDTTQLEQQPLSQSGPQMTSRKTSTVANTSYRRRTRSTTTLRSKFSNTKDDPLNLD